MSVQPCCIRNVINMMVCLHDPLGAKKSARVKKEKAAKAPMKRSTRNKKTIVSDDEDDDVYSD